ncbi:MAG: HAMP domain-containing histidine kinase [Roseburia sp.]|nr:HAMP domain-containing histidine kinase [Roseburia sp.]
MKGIEKLKGYISVKFAAWVALTLCGIICAGSVVAILCFIDMGVYEQTEKEMRQDLFEAASDRYSIQALAQMTQNIDKDKRIDAFSDTKFRYGIIRADNIDDIDLNDPEVYIERNFTQEVALADLYTVQMPISANTTFRCARTIFDHYGIYEEEPASEYVGVPVNAVGYNIATGIFYYICDQEYYPVHNVIVFFSEEDGDGRELHLEYDYEWNMYRNQAREALGKLPDVADADRWKVQWREMIATKEKDGGLADWLMLQPYVTFDMLDSTNYSYGSWDRICLDGEFIEPEEIQEIIAGEMNITDVSDYYYDGTTRSVCVNSNPEVLPESYWVVSILPENMGTSLDSSDLFVQANTVVSIMYTLRYSIYVILLLSFGLGILLLAFLIRAAGHRKGTDEIVTTWLDQIPLDIYLCAAGMAEVTMLIFMSEICYNLERTYPLCGVTGLLMFWLAVLSVLTLAVRGKTERVWKNTVVYRILRWIGKGTGFLIGNLPIFGQVLIALVVIFGMELLLTVLLYEGGAWGVLFWLLEKAAITAFVLWVVYQLHILVEGGKKLAEGDLKYQVDTGRMFWIFKEHAKNLNSIGEGMSLAVEERMKSERFKTELITNVSHDIKTPLTSIINYVDLLEKEELNNENAAEYLEVLERQSERLKKLIQDLIESSKAASGSLPVNLEKLEAGVFLVQTVGEFEEKISENQLELIVKKPEKEVYITADGKYFWRVIDNLMNNICKYAQPSTRVYINMEEKEGEVIIIFRNTSKYPLNISSEELMERFVRGDSSRHTEGSGLGISIAKSLMELMGGAFRLSVDGDLFKVELVFPSSV